MTRASRRSIDPGYANDRAPKDRCRPPRLGPTPKRVTTRSRVATPRPPLAARLSARHPRRGRARCACLRAAQGGLRRGQGDERPDHDERRRKALRRRAAARATRRHARARPLPGDPDPDAVQQELPAAQLRERLPRPARLRAGDRRRARHRRLGGHVGLVRHARAARRLRARPVGPLERAPLERRARRPVRRLLRRHQPDLHRRSAPGRA